MSRSWIELAVAVDNEAVEAVSAMFQRFAHGGVVIDYQSEPGAEVAWNEPVRVVESAPVLVRGFVPATRDGRRRTKLLEEALWHLRQIWPIPDLVTRTVEEDDWAHAWKDHFFVHRIGRDFVICPTWREYEASLTDRIIILDPGMAFGTGLHPTTRLCLGALEDAVKPGARVADVGTGSGILAIGAARLDASRVDAIDIDEVAVDAARSNFALNNLSAVASVRRGVASDLNPGAYDVVVANIIARVILDAAEVLTALPRVGGTLICSGILAERIDEVATALEARGLAAIQIAAEGDWRAIVGRVGPM